MGLNNIRSQAVKPGKVVPLHLNMLAGPEDMVLHVEHLGETNFGFVNDAFAKAEVHLGSLASPEGRRRARERNREYVAKHSVRKIEGFFEDDDAGVADLTRPLASSPTNIAMVVEALPDEVFDLVLAFVSNAENFRDRPAPAPAAAVAKK